MKEESNVDFTILAKFQSELKAPKSQFNKFGNYAYRNAEDILEAAKKIVNPHGFAILMFDQVVQVGDRYYVKATVMLSNEETDQEFSASAYAREEESKKGMDGSQVTGAASSYARKYALNALFAIDDTKDADHESVSNSGTERPKPGNQVKTPAKVALTEDKVSSVVDFIVAGKTMADVEKKYVVSDVLKKKIEKAVAEKKNV